MARIKIRDGGDKDVVLDYLAPIVGVQAITGATVTGYGITTVALSTIADGDIVLAQILSNSSLAAFIMDVVITAGTGFTVKTQNETTGTLVYSVFHPNTA
jgi:hypothetical protein